MYSFWLVPILIFLCATASEFIDTTETCDDVTPVSLSLQMRSTESNESIIPPIFVMNLDRSKDRWERASEEMKKAGLNVQRFSAVDGKKLSNEELMQDTTLLARCLQPRGVIGCYLSHRKFWKMVVRENISAAIIFEDDIQLIDNFKPQLIESLQSLNFHIQYNDTAFTYDVILLGAIGRVHPAGKDNIIARLFSWYYGGLRSPRQITEHLFIPVKPAGTHAYLVSFSGAQKLLSLCPKAVHHVDLDAWRHSELKIFMVAPTLVYQTFEHTSLTDFSAASLNHTTVSGWIEPWLVSSTTIEIVSKDRAQRLEQEQRKEVMKEENAPLLLLMDSVCETSSSPTLINTSANHSPYSADTTSPETKHYTCVNNDLLCATTRDSRTKAIVPSSAVQSMTTTTSQPLFSTLKQQLVLIQKKVADKSYVLYPRMQSMVRMVRNNHPFARTLSNRLHLAIRNSSIVKSVHGYAMSWTEDPLTHQPLSHVLAEPILQLGPEGPILTVGRYLTIISSGCVLYLTLQVFGKSRYAQVVLTGIIGFTVSVRSIIWLLMNWR